MIRESFLSKEELLEQSNAVKRKHERLNEVRKQSKQMSAAILERVKQEAKKQCEMIENQVLAEIRNYHLKELESRRKQYEKCISDINNQHYLQQINIKHLKDGNRSISDGKKSRKIQKTIVVKSNTEKETELNSVIQSASLKENEPERIFRENVEVKGYSTRELPQNVVVDSDEGNLEKTTYSKLSTIPSQVKHVKTLRSVNISMLNDKQAVKYCKHHKKSTHPSSVVINNQELLKNCEKIVNDQSTKTEIDEMYNHLVHDRIRILEQKDKILSRQTLFLPDAVTSKSNKSPRFSEYFTHYFDKQKSSSFSRQVLKENNSNEEKIDEILNDFKRIEMKKKELVEELTNTDCKRDSKTTTSPLQNDRKNTHDKIVSDNEKNSQSSSSDNKSTHLITSEIPKKNFPNKLCPSPIPKISNISSSSSHEPERSKMPKHRTCKKLYRSNKDVIVTVSKEKAIIAQGVPNQNNTTNSNTATEDNVIDSQRKLPVNIVVNIAPSANCKIKIQKNSPEKRPSRMRNKSNTGKVKNWRNVFNNDEKLTASSYYSPPEHCQEIDSQNKPVENISDRVASEEVKDVGYYVRKLLLMSPESVENLDVSSCNASTVNESCIDSADLNFVENCCLRDNNTKRLLYKQKETELNYEDETPEHHETTLDSEYDTETVKKILLSCLKIATNDDNELKFPYYKSINSFSDQKSCEYLPFDQDTSYPNLLHSNFLNTAIRRLLPLYQNSLDKNIDVSLQSDELDLQCTKTSLRHSAEKEFDTDIIQSVDNSYDSTSALLQKFVSSLSPASENRNDNEIINYLKKITDLPSSLLNNKSTTADSNNLKCEALAHQNNKRIDEIFTSLPTIDELIQKGLINKSYISNDLISNEEKEFIDEEEFIKKMLEIDFPSKPSDAVVTVLPSSVTDSNIQRINKEQVSKKETSDDSTNDIRKELRQRGLSWMDTTLQRTLQASAISSTSSAEDSAGQLRKMHSFHEQSINLNRFMSLSRNSNLLSERFSVSPITISDVYLNVPHSLSKEE